MDSSTARRLYADHAHALAYVDVEKPNGDRNIGSAFHVGEGVFVTARHIVEGNKIVEVKITEPVALNTREYFQEVYKGEFSDEDARKHDAAWGGRSLFHKHWLEPLEVVEGPSFAHNRELDVAAFRVRDVHHAAGVVKLGVHWDDWVIRSRSELSDAIVLGYPPIPMVNEPRLIAAKVEIHTWVVPRHIQRVHFIVSGTPRGGFSGGVAIHESGHALGVITSSFGKDNQPEQLGFFAVLSIEGIVECLAQNKLFPEFQRKHYESLLGFDPTSILAMHASDKT
jgi:Trypsin-like peptidase domain